jgi:hypothetical protein
MNENSFDNEFLHSIVDSLHDTLNLGPEPLTGLGHGVPAEANYHLLGLLPQGVDGVCEVSC